MYAGRSHMKGFIRQWGAACGYGSRTGVAVRADADLEFTNPAYTLLP